MWYRLSIAASATLVMSGIAAGAAELPTYEVAGFPVTPHQSATIGAAGAQEQVPTAAPEIAGMPASPHQIAVLTPRDKAFGEKAASGGATTGMARLSPALETEQAR